MVEGTVVDFVWGADSRKMREGILRQVVHVARVKEGENVGKEIQLEDVLRSLDDS